MNPLDRYESLVDDPDAFRAACERPLPSVVRVNTIKTSVERARAALEAEEIAHEPTGWHPGIFRLPEASAGANWAHFHGWLAGQEEVSALPALALDPQPDEWVWDACAAPGSKTTQLADRMDDRGLVVANDNNLGRLSALRSNAERLGVTAVAVTNRDARNFSLNPFGFDAFDRALVDAPCSCEGTCRKNPDVLEEWDLGHVRSLVGVQKGILRRAIQATRPGGTVVYSTCTFAPEENEAVVDHVRSATDCEVVEWEPPADFETSPGLTAWQDQEFDASLSKAHRVYPHQNDTGGFFLAKLRVGGASDDVAVDEEVAT